MMMRRLGRSDLEVSAMGLGCWAMGGLWNWLEADGSLEAVGWGQVDDAEFNSSHTLCPGFRDQFLRYSSQLRLRTQ